MKSRRPILRYFGGKWMLAPWIIEHFPPHRVYVEPYGGGASVLLRKERAHSEVYNDLDSTIVDVFRVLQSKPGELERIIRLTPFSREEYDLFYESTEDQVESARRTIGRSLMGFGGNSTGGSKTGFRTTSVLSNRVPAMDWVNYPDEIHLFANRLAGVVIENRDAKEVMSLQDGGSTLHFVDPPYPHDTRSIKHGYRCEMTDEDHLSLCRFIKELKGMVILCGYRNDIYDRILGWKSIEREALADGARKRLEVLWMNPACIAAQPQTSFDLASSTGGPS